MVLPKLNGVELWMRVFDFTVDSYIVRFLSSSFG